MAITFIGSVEAAASNGADVTLDLSGLGLQQNDLVIVAYAVGDNDNLDFDMAMVTAGYVEQVDLHADDTQDTDLGVFGKFMGATPDASAVVAGRGGIDAAVAAVAMAFRGVDTTTPNDVPPTTATGINGNRPDPPSIDWATAGVWTIAIGAFGHTSGAAVTATAPANYIGLVDASGNDTSDVTVAMAYRTDPADPEDPGIFTPSIADDVAHSWCAVTAALRPAAGGVTGAVAVTDGRDASAASGEVLVNGTAAPVDARDLAAITGLVTVAGTLAVTDGRDAAAASGLIIVEGSIAQTDTRDTAFASGGVFSPITGTVEATDGRDSASASGTVGAEEAARGWLLPNWSWLWAAMMSTPKQRAAAKKKYKRKKREEEEEQDEEALATRAAVNRFLQQAAADAVERAKAEADEHARVTRLRKRRNTEAMFLCGL